MTKGSNEDGSAVLTKKIAIVAYFFGLVTVLLWGVTVTAAIVLMGGGIMAAAVAECLYPQPECESARFSRWRTVFFTAVFCMTFGALPPGFDDIFRQIATPGSIRLLVGVVAVGASLLATKEVVDGARQYL